MRTPARASTQRAEAALQIKRFSDAAKAWEQRLLTLEDTDPIPYRTQNGGDYEIPALTLRSGRESVGDRGFGMHQDSSRR